MSTAATLCIFARAPVAGRVKSRLAGVVGADAALAAHIDLVEDTLNRLADIDVAASELWLDDADDPDGREWARRWRLPLRGQPSGDLGTRMCRALESCLATGTPGIVVGTDCPAIDRDYVGSAVTALGSHDVVLGPAADGGYGLVGVRRPAPEIFRDIAWGSTSVLTATLAAAHAAGRSVARLETIWDVDTAADWRRYRELRG